MTSLEEIERAKQEGRQQAWEIIVDEFAELMLYFHRDAKDGQRILKTQKRIADGLKLLNPPIHGAGSNCSIEMCPECEKIDNN